jgi:hypothetical protein
VTFSVGSIPLHAHERLLAHAGMALLLLCLTSLPMFAQTQTTPDNSGTNKSQNQGGSANQQPNNKSDVQLTAEIRRSAIWPILF